MYRWVFAAMIGATVAAPSIAIAAPTPTPFTDTACPQANASGRRLNELNAAGSASSADILGAAQGLVVAYTDCVKQFDALNNSENVDHQTDYIPLHRAFARLQLAKSLQRVASFETQLHEPDKARANYDAALITLSQLAGLMDSGASHIGTGDTPEGKVAIEGQALHDQIVAAEAKLPAAGSATPVPGPSTTR